MTIVHTRKDTEPVDTSRDLIFSLSLDEEIIHFNKESERFTGYTRDEILHKRFYETLVPQESITQWRDLLDSIRHMMWVDDVVLPLKTKNNQTYLLTWTGFLVKDQHGSVKDICIFGKPLNTKTIPKKPSDEMMSSLSTSTDSPGRAAGGEAVLSRDDPPESPRPVVEDGSVAHVASSDASVNAAGAEAVLSRDDPPESSKPVVEEGSVAQVASSDEPVEVPEFEAVASKDASEETVPRKNTEMIIKHRLKKILFASKKREEEHTTDKAKEQFIAPLETMGKLLETTTQKLDFINDSLIELSKKYETITYRVTELERKDQQWENHRTMQCTQPSAEEDIQQPLDEQNQDEQKKPDPDNLQLEEQQPVPEKLGFFSDPFGFKRQHKELDLKKQQLETRLKELEDGEEQLQRERTFFNARVEEFSKWQEKLMLLEKEIEKRRQELMKQENMLFAQSTASCLSYEKNLAEPERKNNTENSFISEPNETLEKIPQSAAIIQRGILKQINTSFGDLLGYPADEIIEKSFFDFIALEGLADIEKYYLDRLKGDTVSMYNTVLSAKDNNKIPVEVTIKQTIYNGDKAEILIIGCVDS